MFFDVFAPPEGVFAPPEGGGRGFFDVLGAPWALRRVRGVRRGGPVAVCATSTASTLDLKEAFGRPREPFGRFWGAFESLKGRLGSFLDGLGGHFRQACGEKVKSGSKCGRNVFYFRFSIDLGSFADPKNDVFVWEG